MENMHMQQFEHKLSQAIEQVKVVLSRNKVPCMAADVHHGYEDKYLLAERVTNVAASSQLAMPRGLQATWSTTPTLGWEAWCMRRSRASSASRQTAATAASSTSALGDARVMPASRRLSS